MIFINKPKPRMPVAKIFLMGLSAALVIGGSIFGMTYFKAQPNQVAVLEPQAVTTRNDTSSLLTLAAVPLLSTSDPLPLVPEAEQATSQVRLEELTVGLIVGQLAQDVVNGEFDLTATDLGNGTSSVALNTADTSATAAVFEQVILESVNAGTITLSDRNVASDGSIDTRAVLFELVEQSLSAGSLEQQEAATQLRKEVSEVLQVSSEIVDGTRYYTVEPGDSLAYIALQFYGSTRKIEPIFEANSDKLSSPDQIQVGQRLIIPQI